MRLKPTYRLLFFTGLFAILLTEAMVARIALAFNTSRIVFTSLRDGNNEIYVMDADGGNQENLTNNPAYDGDPDWSPDGTKIAFASSRDGSPSQIHVMNADGKNVIRLTDGRGGKRDPDWSPDGKKIAFSVDDREDHIAVMDADGNNREQLEDQAMGTSWSPDGKQIAFMSWRDGHHEIYVIGVGGQGRKKVTQDLVGKWRPSFSPDGRRIAYMAEHKGFYHIYVVDSDGRNLHRLTHNEENHWAPAWSPDGQVIAYYVWDGILEGKLHGMIHLMASNGKYLKQLSDVHDARDYQPDFSPVGLAVPPTSKTAAIWGRLKKSASNRR